MGKHSLVFFINGRKVEEESPSPETTLLQYLRRVVFLPGTKGACEQGGCGSCTVMISQKIDNKLVHFCVNACLVPICYLHGMAVTTVEGVGGTEKGLHPVQRSLVDSHGLQCGFCTPGMVMTMYTLFHNVPQPTADQMERALEGNLCRCTGYRPIIDAFKQASKACPCGLGLCQQSDSTDSSIETKTVTEQNRDPSQSFIFPPELQVKEEYRKSSVVFTKGDYSWYRPGSLSDLLQIKQQNPDACLLMGCTSVGFLLRTGQMKSKTIICGSNVPELCTVEVTDTEFVIGSAVTMRSLEQALNDKAKGVNENQLRTFDALQDGLRWIGADQIRNMATIGGHIMSQAPNHDLQTLLMAMGAQLNFLYLDKNNTQKSISCRLDDTFLKNGPGRFGTAEIMTSISIPLTSKEEYVSFFKQPGRRGFDYAVLNAGICIQFKPDSHVVKQARICLGNIDKKPVFVKSAESELEGKKWEDIDFSSVTDKLITELSSIEKGEDLKFKTTLAASFLYKFSLQMNKSLKIQDKDLRESSAADKLKIDPSTGIQIYDVPDDDGKHVVWKPVPNVGSEYIVAGEAVFIDDMPKFSNELYAAVVTSTRSHAKILNVDASEALAVPGVVDYICHKDIPGCNKFGLMIHDTPLFAEEEVLHYGQLIGAVLADTREIASKAAKLVKVDYEDLEAIYTIDEAIEKKSFYDLGLSIDEGDMDKAITEAAEIVCGEVESHAQEHLYLEPQTALVVPKIEQREMDVYSATQAINEIQTEISSMLSIPRNRINVRVRRVGGAFGGKAFEALMPSGVAAVAALKTKRPVRVVFDRALDMRSTGKRHPIKTWFKAAVTKEGKLLGLELKVYLNAGWNLGLSFFVLTCALPYNSPYKIPVARMNGVLCRTNSPSNTAFRGFGHPQKLFYMETIMRAISHKLGLSVDKVKEINFVNEGDTILANMKLEGIFLHQCWNRCKEQADYDTRVKEIEKFNRENRWKKRGIAMTPTVFNLGYPVNMMLQGYALLHAYLDGTVLLTHGGIEMGQGVNTKVQQIAATVLEIPITDILIGETSSSTVANTFESGGSFVADINGGATKVACETLMERLKPFREAIPGGTFKDWVGAALASRVSLSVMGHYKVPGMTTNFDVMKRTGDFTWYFTHNAACSEVEIDCLTGEHQLIKTDIVMDLGQSLNPAVDIGQIEGGFIQGYGLMTSEAVYLKPNGQVKNSGPLDYKIPGVRNIPRKLNVTLLKDNRFKKSLYSAKGCGEPPLLLGVSVHEALEEAVMAARKDSGKDEYYQLPCPATVDKIRMACGDAISQQCDKQLKASEEKILY
ncbi:xanthine dehydrogenase/oxidase-like [Mytilus edulis]|uniref:xanthine dehydrogenase/oxidase-like n=1 Tax=Mytilus edulis TaxID=6550 RepID=UPI0039F09ED1